MRRYAGWSVGSLELYQDSKYQILTEKPAMLSIVVRLLSDPKGLCLDFGWEDVRRSDGISGEIKPMVGRV
jgi:hypothetical protein